MEREREMEREEEGGGGGEGEKDRRRSSLIICTSVIYIQYFSIFCIYNNILAISVNQIQKINVNQFVHSLVPLSVSKESYRGKS